MGTKFIVEGPKLTLALSFFLKVDATNNDTSVEYSLNKEMACTRTTMPVKSRHPSQFYKGFPHCKSWKCSKKKEVTLKKMKADKKKSGVKSPLNS